MPPLVEFLLLVAAIALLARWARQVGAKAGVPAALIGIGLSFAID